MISLGLALVLTGAACSAENLSENEVRNMKIIAHRGGSSLGNENTLSCIAAGMAAGADMVEIDVHQTADGALVVCHDMSVDRTTDGKGRIEDLTLAQIRSLRIVGEDGVLTDEHIPTLDEVLDLIDGRCGLLLEVKRRKHQYEGIEERVVEALERHNAVGYTVVQSFNDRVIETVHRLNPEIRVEKLLFCRVLGLPLIFDGTFTSFSWDKYGYVASFNFYHSFINRRLLDEIHERGKEVKVWTVNDKRSFPKIPVDGVITDCPDKF